MKKIIGGLLVISLLSRPSLLKVDYIAYEIYKASDQILKGIRSMQEREAVDIGTDIGCAEINEAFDNIDKSAKSISRLLSSMNGSIERLNAALYQRSHTKEPLTEAQIDTFSAFNAYYAGETSSLYETLSLISDDILANSLKNEILSEDTDYAQLYERLQAVIERQYEAIAHINGVISAAGETLMELNNDMC